MQLIRIAVAAVLVLPCAAAEREVLTLVDGREVVGIYDAGAQCVDTGRGRLPVSPRQIRSRRPAPSDHPIAAIPTGAAAARMAAIDLSTKQRAADEAAAAAERSRDAAIV